MARLDVEISDELAGWIQDEVKKGKSTKVAFVTSILEAARGSPEAAPIAAMKEADTPREREPGNPPGPPREVPREPGSNPDAIKKMAVTLEIFFKRYLFDHPPRPGITDEDEEALEERWETMAEIIDAELAK